MTYPNDYTRGYGFGNFQDSHPTTPLPGVQLDVELDNVHASTDSIISALEGIMRSDGALANQIVGVDQLAPEVSAVLAVGTGAPRGAWATSTAYVAKDVVTNGGVTYLAVSAHTSVAAFATDYAAGKWVPITAAPNTVLVGIAALKAFPPADGTRLWVEDYIAGDNVPRRRYKCTSTNPGSDDGGSIIASNTAGYWWTLMPVSRVDIRWFGAVLDDVWSFETGTGTTNTNNFTAFKNAMLYLNTRGIGGTFYIPGPCGVSSAAWAAYGSITMTTQCKIKIKFEGGRTSWLRLTGTSDVSEGIIWLNKSQIRFCNGGLIGNSKGGGGNQRFMYFHCSSAATRDMVGISFQNMWHDNFGNDNWYAFVNDSGGYRLRHVDIDGDVLFTRNGNAYDVINVGHSSTQYSFYGTSGSPISDVRMSRATGDGSYVKSYVFVWSYCENFYVGEGFRLTDYGKYGVNDRGCYALAAYDVIGTASHVNINFEGAEIVRPRSNGVYTAGTGQVNTNRLKVSGQFDTTAGSLPYGGISLNGTWGHCNDNVLIDNVNGIYASGSDGQISILSKNVIKSTVTNGIGVRLGANAYSIAPKVILDGNQVKLTGADSIALNFVGSSGSPGVDVAVVGGSYEALGRALLVHNGSGAAATFANMLLTGGVKFGGACVTAICNIIATTGLPLQVFGVDVNCSALTGAVPGFSAPGVTKLQIDGLYVHDYAAATNYALNLDGCRGGMRNVTRDNIVDAKWLYSTDFGYAKPNWTATKGTFIQNLYEVNSAGSAIEGHANDNASTTWTTRARAAA